jgi:glutaredoxin
MKVKLYTTHCPKCKILEERLNEKKIKFEIIDNVEELQKMNFKTVPNLDIDGKIYKEDFGTTFAGQPVTFMWKSPFLAVTTPHHRKMIDEFYFLLDTEHDNNFDFSVYKDYDSEFSDDIEKIYSVHPDHLIWADNDTSDNLPCHWGEDEENLPVWAVNKDSMEKAEISEANYAIQLCVQGNEAAQSCAIIGLQFREVYNDD